MALDDLAGSAVEDQMFGEINHLLANIRFGAIRDLRFYRFTLGRTKLGTYGNPEPAIAGAGFYHQAVQIAQHVLPGWFIQKVVGMSLG